MKLAKTHRRHEKSWATHVFPPRITTDSAWLTAAQPTTSCVCATNWVDSVPDAVVYPDTAEQVEKIVAYVTEKRPTLYVYGGGSSVTRAWSP